MKKYKIRLLNYLLKNLYNTITEDDVLKLMGVKYVRGQEVISQGELDILKEEAKYILKSRTWEEMQNKIKLAANESMFNKSKVIDDMIFGKAMLKSAKTYDNILRTLSNLK